MSFVAKVFVVFNLLLSALFFYFAMYEWTAQVKWQKMYEQEKALKVVGVAEVQANELKLAQEVVKAQQKELAAKGELSKEKLARDQERDNLLKVQSELTQAKNANELALASKEEVEREYRRVTQELGKARAVVLKIEQALNVANDNAIRAQNQKAETEVQYNQLNGLYQAQSRDVKKMQDDIASANATIERAVKLGFNVYGDDTEPTQPPIDARVLAVRNDVGTVMLSAGTKQNVKIGYRFVLFRGDKYIGKVQVEKAYDDMCAAKILGDYENKEHIPIEVHDLAKTR